MLQRRIDLVDRDHERALLRALFEREEPSIALVTGRRRVGKTFLLTRTWPEDQVFLFTATATTPEQNRRQLLLDLASWSGEDIEPDDFPTWRSVFDLIWRLRDPEPMVVVLDEFQYVASEERGLAEVASAINAVLERRSRARPLVLVLSGSAVSTLEALAAGGAPLFGRLDVHLRLEPLTVFDTAAFTPGWSHREKAAAFGVLGGTPAYWAALDPKATLRENVARLLLAKEGRLRLQLDTVLAQEEGLGDVAAYSGIVRAVASGATTRPRIADATGLKADASLVRRLDTLVEIGVLRQVDVIGAPPNAPVRYRITDPALRFYHAFVTPHASLLERSDPLAVYDQVVAPRLETFLGPPFEELVAPTYERLREARSLPLVEHWSRWEGQDRRGESLEIDVVAPLVDGPVMTGAVKFQRRAMGADVLQQHLDAVRRAREAGLKWAYAAGERAPLVFLSAGGYTEKFEAAVKAYGGRVWAWTLEDVYGAG